MQIARETSPADSGENWIDQTLSQDADSMERARAQSSLAGAPPAAVPGYRILKPIGEGKYGSVWLAREQNTGKHVAIKFYTHRRGVDWSLLGREVEKLAVLYTSRSIVGLLAVGWDHDPPYYVMEYLENGSLASSLASGPLPTVDAVRIATRICQALVHAHGSGILHCDLKPANILLDQDFEPRLCDFGQSRLADEHSHALGTLYYMAPEQADLRAVPDARWDVYALGALIYHMLTGAPPFRTEENDKRLNAARTLNDRLNLYRQIVRQGPKPVAHRKVAGVDPQLAELVDRCLAPDASRRLTNAQAVLDRLVARERFRARRPLILLGLILPLLLLCGIAPLALEAMNDAVNTAQSNLTRRAMESDVLSANLLAESIKRELDDRLTELEGIAAIEELQQAVIDYADKPKADRRPLLTLLDKLKGKSDQHRRWVGRSDDASWFLLDASGYQRWRDPMSPTVDRNWSHRDYFHGGGFDFPKDDVPVDVHAIRERNVSIAYRGTSTGRYVVALSVPVFAPNDEMRVIGVLARTLSLSSLLQDYEKSLRSQRSDGVGRKFAIVDSRALDGRRKWNLLAHDWMSDEHLAAIKGDDIAKLQLIGVAPPAVVEDLEHFVQSSRSGDPTYEYDRTRHYIDPVGQMDHATYGGVWLAAFSTVGNTGWVAVVQERKDGALRAVEELQSRMLSSAIGAVVLVLALVAGSWWLIVIVLSDRGFRWLRFGRRRHGASVTPQLTSLTSRGGDSA
ncbi:MAG: Serine/threonine protein kinaserelated protein [Schlesneria sp.]|nr:Serine/threonine protein kinaserelated protein [Schlesneria sp.]